MRTASNFFELAILAASFLIVTTRELNNSIRTPFLPTGPPSADAANTEYLQYLHWKYPPDDALSLVSRHLESLYSQEQLKGVAMDKILVWNSSLITHLFKFTFCRRNGRD